MQLRNIQQIAEHVEVYYECMLKLTNYLQVRATIVFLTIVFKVTLLPYLKLATTCMKRNTLIEHKEVIIVCEESGHVSMNYNVLLTTLEANVGVKLIVPAMITKLALTYTNCGKIDHLVETCHNKKKRYQLCQPLQLSL
jgi:hypothetical protein